MIVDLDLRGDDRGWFARSWCAEEMAAAGLPAEVSQMNLSFNEQPGTLRGLHRQRPPHHEAKLVRCLTGAMVDVRPDSPTYLHHVMVELTPSNRRALQLPAYVAHGFQTLEPATTVLYVMDGPYAPGAEQGFPHDDPAFGLRWPLPVAELSGKDSAWPPFAHVDTRETMGP